MGDVSARYLTRNLAKSLPHPYIRTTDVEIKFWIFGVSKSHDFILLQILECLILTLQGNCEMRCLCNLSQMLGINSRSADEHKPLQRFQILR